MHLLNKAYDQLRKRLVDAENKSKYDVLVQAKEYIKALATICEKFDQKHPDYKPQPQITTTTTTATTTITPTTITTLSSQERCPNYNDNQLIVDMTPSPQYVQQQVSPISLIKQENKLNQFYQLHNNQYQNFYHDIFEQHRRLQQLDSFRT